ncbi:Uncharacterised protein [Mycobacteroides abscessus subsp. abscessus]|nr:Uncharacterised protein [Mycobacteroides abscessus subsp. abscessus]
MACRKAPAREDTLDSTEDGNMSGALPRPIARFQRHTICAGVNGISRNTEGSRATSDAAMSAAASSSAWARSRERRALRLTSGASGTSGLSGSTIGISKVMIR